ncbi:MAG: hypothetical protein ACFFCW_11630 [Candidatus Hodarchaeota archaeon]
MDSIAGKWNFAYDWHNRGNFLIVRLVIDPNGHFYFPDFTVTEGRWAQVDGNVIMKLSNITDTSYSGSTVGYVMMGMIEEKYTEVPLSATGTWFAFRADSELTVFSSWNYLVTKKDVVLKKWKKGMPKPFEERGSGS